jgi:two-component system, OmpR family, response regulator
MILDKNNLEEWMDPQRLFCDMIGPHALMCDDGAMKLFVDEHPVECSRLEYRIVKLLLPGRLVTDQKLVREVYGSANLALHIEPLSKHIERLRKKLQPCGLAIPRVSKYGYLLHSTDEQSSVS